MIRTGMAAAIAALLMVTAPSLALAQRQDVIRGRVTGSTGQPIAGVNVRATSYTGGVMKPAKTDRDGRYTIVFPNGEGNYWLEFSLIGYIARRFEIKRVADEEILLGDARLVSSIASLDAVNVTANAARALPARTDAVGDISGTDRVLTVADLPVDAVGNLAVMASLVPGMQLIPGLDGAPDAFSALGLGPDQNTTTLNGLGSGLSLLPRDAQTTTSVRTFNYDPSIGGFGGAQIALVTRSGTNLASRLVSGVTRGPPTEFTTDIADEQGAKNTVFSIGGNASGPIRLDRAFYSMSYQADRDWRDSRTMLTASDRAFTAAGVVPDSVGRLLQILGARGLTTGVPDAPPTRTTSRFALQGNLDLTPASTGVGHAFTLSTTANVARTANASDGPGAMLAVPAHNARLETASGSVALRHSNYFWFGVLTGTTFGASISTSSMAPYLRAPQGNVRVRSELPDGPTAIRTLRFGGSPIDVESRSSTLELHNQSVWYEGNNRHAVKLTSSIRYERFRATQDANARGTFTFGSLANLEAGIPDAFDRQLGSRDRQGGQLVGFAALGDAWRPTRDFQLQYGLRVDAQRLTTAPAYNPAIDDRFGYRTDAAPSRVYASPRLGVQWTYGAAPQVIRLLDPIARPPRAVVQGGVGVFQNVAPAQTLLNPVVDNTGLAGATRTLRCVGAAAPAPAWADFAVDASTIPDRCADGSAGTETTFATGAPSVAVYDPRYRQPGVLRANVSWSSPVLSNRFVLGASAQFQRGFHQPATVDANLNATPRFALTNENGRPVFVPADAIVPTTGASASSANRLDAAFDRVSVLGSSLRQKTHLASVSLRPALAGTHFNWTVTYTVQRAREEFVGFTSAAGDPFAREWGRALLPRTHAVTATFFYNALDLVRLNGLVAMVSGVAFTPSVLGDVNGDGAALNDRAFVFDPAQVSDSALAAGMSRVLSGGSLAGRRCLQMQLGALSSRGSCRGPWQTMANLNASLNSQKVGLPARLRVTINVNNPLVLADILINGQDGVRGWGQAIAPDPVLLAVRGFDAEAQRFRYDVNERFGSTRPTQTVQRGQTYLALSIGYDLGPSRERQLLTQRLDVGRTQPGARQLPAAIKAFGTSTIPNPIALILQQPDSFRLTRLQADSLVTMNRSYALLADSLWSAAAADLAKLPDGYDRDAAYDRYVSARERVIDRLIVMAPHVISLLTPVQRRTLPQAVRDWLDVRVLRAIRSSTSG